MARRASRRPGRVASLEIPGYERAEEVRRDSCGVVCRAWDTEAERFVEVRLLSITALDEETRTDLRDRLRGLESLPAHPHLATVLTTGVTDAGRGYVVGGAEPGGSLADRVRTTGGLPWRDVAAVGAAVASGLETAHAAGVVHGAIRPECILLSALGEPRLAGLGLVQLVSQLAAGETEPAPLTAEADVSALAATLRTSIGGGSPDALREVLERAMSPDSADRPAPAAALGHDLRGALAAASAVAPDAVDTAPAAVADPPPAPPQPAPPGRSISRRTALYGTAAAAVLLTFGGMILAPRLAGDVVRLSDHTAVVDDSARTMSIDPSHWAPVSRWNLAGPVLTADHAVAAGAAPAITRVCGKDVGSFVYTFPGPRVRGSTYVVGVWLSSDVAQRTASPEAFSDVTLIVNGNRYHPRPVGAVSAHGQYFEWRVRGRDVRSGSNSMEYAVGADSTHRRGLCMHFSPPGAASPQAITVRSVG
ncbi:MAG TPA: hypothetical protein VGP96_04960 [Candidatus Dormibacteraeota bacterium]|nr:hypothetical protein [Candidatus Dormibacteraeota bacterium]